LHGNEWWPAPAKLNLFLHVLGQREDGYHRLQTVFQFIDLCDHLSYQVNRDASVHCQFVDGTPPADQDLSSQQNIACKAARLLQLETGCELGVQITLDKRIPVGAGLGGGSSDAATTLIALNYLWNLRLDTARLAKIALTLGADVPVFVHGEAAWAEGVGEYFEPVNLPEPFYLVIYPGVRVSTAEIFASTQLTRDSRPIKIADFLAGRCGNDCQQLVAKKYPPVREALAWLSDFQPAMMTGTGACVFARFATRQEAEQVLEQVPADWQGFLVKGCNQSPLHLYLEEQRMRAVAED